MKKRGFTYRNCFYPFVVIAAIFLLWLFTNLVSTKITNAPSLEPQPAPITEQAKIQEMLRRSRLTEQQRLREDVINRIDAARDMPAQNTLRRSVRNAVVAVFCMGFLWSMIIIHIHFKCPYCNASLIGTRYRPTRTDRCVTCGKPL